MWQVWSECEKYCMTVNCSGIIKSFLFDFRPVPSFSCQATTVAINCPFYAVLNIRKSFIRSSEITCRINSTMILNKRLRLLHYHSRYWCFRQFLLSLHQLDRLFFWSRLSEIEFIDFQSFFYLNLQCTWRLRPFGQSHRPFGIWSLACVQQGTMACSKIPTDLKEV